MAGRKKAKKKLTQEEWLEQALVPEEEWPYKVPGNWCWTRIEFCCEDFFSGKSPKYSKEPTPYRIIGQQANQRYGIDLKYIKYGTEEFTLKQEDRYFLKYNDVILNTLGTGSIGRSNIYKYEHRMLTDGHPFVFRTGSRYSPDLLYYYFQVNETQIINSANGSTNQKFLSLKAFSKYCIPLPPLTEQGRIVARIESLFNKLDEAKKKTQAVIDSFELRKSAILHKAFTGELTEQWRKAHGIGLDSWTDKTLESVCYSIFDGDHMPPPKCDAGIPFLVISNVNTGYLSFNNTRFVPESYYNALSDTRKPKYGDILYTLVGSYGIPVVVDIEKPFCFQRHMALLKPKDVEARYLWYVLQSKAMLQKATEIATGTAQLTVPIRGLRKMKIPYISRVEQIEIVRILDILFVKERKVRESAKIVLKQIDLIKKSILARAFRGELGTNDPAEESAITLLRKMWKESTQNF